jgi:DNA-binding MarR family transcriptional regulator
MKLMSTNPPPSQSPEAASPAIDRPDGDSPPKLRLERFLPYRLNVVGWFASRALARVYGEHFGIGIPEWRVIAMLGEFGRLTSRDIGELSQMHKTKVSRAVTELDSRGLVMRSENRNDRREAFLELSGPGRRIYDEIVPMALAFEQRLLDGISHEERTTFERVLATLTERGRLLSAGFRGEPL